MGRMDGKVKGGAQENLGPQARSPLYRVCLCFSEEEKGYYYDIWYKIILCLRIKNFRNCETMGYDREETDLQ